MAERMAERIKFVIGTEDSLVFHTLDVYLIGADLSKKRLQQLADFELRAELSDAFSEALFYLVSVIREYAPHRPWYT